METLTLKRFAIYLITFFTLLIVALTITKFWKDWDYAFYKKVYMNESDAASKLSSRIAVVNIEKPNLDSKNESLKQFRKKIISFLNTVQHHNTTNQESPTAVILDISFSNDTIQLKELKEAIKKVRAKRIDVYAVYSLRNYYAQDSIFETNDFKQAKTLYDSDSILVGGRLHAGFVADKELIHYPSDLFLKTAFGDTLKIESIIKRIALNDDSNSFPNEFENLAVPLGPIEAIEKQRYDFVAPDESSKSIGSFNVPLKMHKKYVIAGDLKNDFQKDISMPRTYFLAWALNEKIIDVKIAKQPITNLAIILGQTLFFSLFTVFVFALLFKYIKRLQTKPKTLAVISFLISAIFFATYGLLVFAFNKVIPIGMTLMGMAVAAFLTWRYALKFLVMGIIEGGGVYDVFISYSHNDYDWVKKNLYLPLSEFKKEDGNKLKIFFDEKSIGIGEQFTIKYMKGIADSKVIIPVISKSYNVKNHCQNELNIAIKRSVEKLMIMTPITFDFADVPEILTHILVLDVNQNKNYLESIKTELNKTLK
ncbi:toll/interleukin-1 receptor domain-containing protein [Gelatiniphilus marinus]|uniref:Toll/interleukin-1 receptor domain-containing protein n=1 Tax=Gelatiniphilus marinus TaxID=1759464 RepID=A0ABW5JTJ1_9FLAO